MEIRFKPPFVLAKFRHASTSWVSAGYGEISEILLMDDWYLDAWKQPVHTTVSATPANLTISPDKVEIKKGQITETYYPGKEATILVRFEFYSHTLKAE